MLPTGSTFSTIDRIAWPPVKSTCRACGVPRHRHHGDGRALHHDSSAGSVAANVAYGATTARGRRAPPSAHERRTLARARATTPRPQGAVQRYSQEHARRPPRRRRYQPPTPCASTEGRVNLCAQLSSVPLRACTDRGCSLGCGSAAHCNWPKTAAAWPHSEPSHRASPRTPTPTPPRSPPAQVFSSLLL